MRFLLSWLKEFIELSLPPQALAERLTLAGLEVTSLTRLEGDWLFEAEVTPNRPDLLSHLGIAREAAAALGRTFRTPRWLQRETQPLRSEEIPLEVVVEDPEGCRRYVGIVMEGVQVKPSPPALAARLTCLGIRPVNNVVDVTNLCLLELGQPLHAFDLDTLQGKTIRVRRARAGEKLATLDGVNRILSPEMLVIADEKRPVALAGVMGGSPTEITARTRRVFLESAWFDPLRVRRGSRLARISSDSSYRFERGVDPEKVPAAAIRAARWILRLGGGQIQGGLADVGQKETERDKIALRPQKTQEILGIRSTADQQRRILENLGCQVVRTGRGLRVQPPSWRQDLRIPEDLYEEVARLWGYDRCPDTLPPVFRRTLTPEWTPGAELSFTLEEKIRRYLTAAGLQEVMTYSLIRPEDHARAKATRGAALELANPLSVEHSVLRKTLLIGALQSVARNLNRKAAESFQMFEIGAVYEEENANPGLLPREWRKLGLLIAGTPVPDWGKPSAPLEVFHLKGVIRFLCERLRVGIAESVASPSAVPLPGPAIRFQADGKILGEAGAVSGEVLRAFEIPAELPVFYAELDLQVLAEAAASSPELRVKPLPKIPPAMRDLAVVLAEEVPHAELLRAIQQAGQPLLESAALFDLYRGRQVPAGKKSLAFRLGFSAGDRTLTEEEISSTHQKILQALEKKFSATLRS